MNIDEIIETRTKLDNQLKNALATMELKKDIKDICDSIKELQAQCPHFSDKYNFTWVDNTCPYCGKKEALK